MRLSSRLFITVLLGLSAGCGSSKIEQENQSLKEEIARLKSEQEAHNIVLREKDLEIQEAKLSWEREKLEITSSLTAGDTQHTQLEVDRKPETLQSVRVADLLVTETDISPDLLLVGVLEKCDFLKNQTWRNNGEQLHIYTADVDRRQLADKKVLRSLMLALVDMQASRMVDGGRIGTAFKKIASLTTSGVADRISDDDLNTLQDIVEENLPEFSLGLEVLVTQQGTILRNLEFTVKGGEERSVEVPVPEHALVFGEIVTNESPVGIVAKMLREFALDQVVELATNLVIGVGQAAVAIVSESDDDSQTGSVNSSNDIGGLSVEVPSTALVGVPFKIELTAANTLDRAMRGTLALSILNPDVLVEPTTEDGKFYDVGTKLLYAPTLGEKAKTIVSEHPLVEMYDGEWPPDQVKRLVVNITPRKAGNLTFKVRATYVENTSEYRLASNIPGDGPKDQQGFSCQEYTVLVK